MRNKENPITKIIHPDGVIKGMEDGIPIVRIKPTLPPTVFRRLRKGGVQIYTRPTT